MLYSIGYGGRSFKGFIAELQKHKIDVLIDIRSYPQSRQWWFSRKHLEKNRLPNRIKYRWAGHVLGGKNNNFNRTDKADYLEDILSLAGCFNVALMCAERDPDHCHRKLELDPIINQLGGQIEHIK